MFRLRVLSGPLEGEIYKIDGETVIGRSPDSEIQLLDTGVSRRHCCLLEDDSGNPVLVDLSSANGTSVGGEKISRLTLNPGDEFCVGTSTMIVEAADGSEPPTAPEVRLASGPAATDTDIRPPEPFGCGSPLHVIAIQREWKHCPSCGREIEPDESLPEPPS